MRTIEEIAELCHETNRHYCLMLGDDSQFAWPNAPHMIKQSAIAGVVRLSRNPNLTPAEVHQSWFEHKKNEGWTYGAIKDLDAKTHPCMVPYDQLPPEQRVKDRLFRAIVLALIVGDDDAKN